MSESPQMNSDQGQAWLRRFVARVMRQEHGDVIAANVAEGARNVAVGKFVLQNNVQIGTLVVPVRFILALLVMVVVLAVAVWYLVVPYQMPRDTFNVAVADFGQVDKDGYVRSSRDGSSLSQWMFGQLRTEAAALPKGIKVEFWHDSLGLLHKRSTIGVVATEAQAADLAKRIDAHMVVYGALDPSQDPATFTPKFYVAAVISETAEVVGGQRLGSPIPFRAPVDFNDIKTGVYFEQNLKPRAEALVWFTRGLSFDLTGRSDQALQVFREAEQSAAWPDDQGAEILYVFMGREAMFLAHDDSVAKKMFDSATDAVAFAESAFRKALAINPSYDRAHLWLGNVYFQKAQDVLAARQLDQASLDRVRANLDQATAEYQEALRDAESPNSVVSVRTQLSLGMVDYLKAASYLLAGDNAAAEPLYSSAIDQIQTTLPMVDQDEHRILAQVYQTLGAAYYAQGHASLANKKRSRELWERAVYYYDQCDAQVKADPYDAFLQSLEKQHCAPERQDVVRARDKLGSGS